MCSFYVASYLVIYIYYNDTRGTIIHRALMIITQDTKRSHNYDAFAMPISHVFLRHPTACLLCFSFLIHGIFKFTCLCSFFYMLAIYLEGVCYVKRKRSFAPPSTPKECLLSLGRQLRARNIIAHSSWPTA